MDIATAEKQLGHALTLDDFNEHKNKLTCKRCGSKELVATATVTGRVKIDCTKCQFFQWNSKSDFQVHPTILSQPSQSPPQQSQSNQQSNKLLDAVLRIDQSLQSIAATLQKLVNK